MQSRVKTESIYIVDEIKRLREEAKVSFKSSNHADNLIVKEAVAKDYNGFLNSINDEPVRNFYLMANLVAISDRARRGRDIVQSFIKNLELMISSVDDYERAVRELNLQLGKVDIHEGDARHLFLEDESVEGIITSPPYSIALDYVANDARAFEAMGYDLDKMRDEFVGVRGRGETRIKLYNEDMMKSFHEMHRVLKKGRCCAIVVGNATYQKHEFKTIEFTIEQCKKARFHPH